MRFGVFSLIPRRDLGQSPAQLFAEAFELAGLADASEAFDTAWIAEHHFSNYGMVPAPLTYAVKLAERTRRLKLVTAVLVLPFYQPLRLAEDIALVDNLIDGRLVVGVGRGYQPYEFARFGLTLDDSRGLFDETLEIVLRALSQRTFSFEGQHFNIPSTSLALRPLQQPHPPFVVAATTPETLLQAARHGFGVVSTASWNPIEEIAKTRQVYREQVALAGRPPEAEDFSCMRFVYVTDSKADMLEAAEQALWITRVSAGFRFQKTNVVDGEATLDYLEGEPTPEVFAERMIFGDPETCIEKLERLRELLRPTRLVCNVQLAAFPHERVRRSFERFAERVAPHFTATTAAEPVEAR